MVSAGSPTTITHDLESNMIRTKPPRKLCSSRYIFRDVSQNDGGGTWYPHQKKPLLRWVHDNHFFGFRRKKTNKHHIFFRLPPWIFERKTCFPSPPKKRGVGLKLGAKGYDAILGILDPPRFVRFSAIFITQKMLCGKETSHSRIPGTMDIYIYI